MNNQETVDQLNELKLNGMATAFEAMLNMPLQARPTVEQAVAKMVEVEKDYRRNKRTALFLKGSKLRYNAVLEEVLCSTSRNFTKDQLYALADCGFIRRNENLFIQGKCGCGKSFLACAIGHQACFLGYRTMYYNMNRFVEKIMVSKLDGTLLKFIEVWGNTNCLSSMTLDYSRWTTIPDLHYCRYWKTGMTKLPQSLYHNFPLTSGMTIWESRQQSLMQSWTVW